MRWNELEGYWELTWKWADSHPPPSFISSGVGKSNRSRLTAEQEEIFYKNVDSWFEKGWFVEHDEHQHGPSAAVLPFLAVVQEHKATTPVCPCLDHWHLNNKIMSVPGLDAPAL